MPSPRPLPTTRHRPTPPAGSHVFQPRLLRHPHVVGAVVVCAVCCTSAAGCVRPRRRAVTAPRD